MIFFSFIKNLLLVSKTNINALEYFEIFILLFFTIKELGQSLTQNRCTILKLETLKALEYLKCTYWKQIRFYFPGLFHKVLAHVLQELLGNYTAYSPQREFEIWVMVV